MKYHLINNSIKAAGLSKALYLLMQPGEVSSNYSLLGIIQHYANTTAAIMCEESQQMKVHANANVEDYFDAFNDSFTEEQKASIRATLLANNNIINVCDMLPDTLPVKTFEEMDLLGWFNEIEEQNNEE